MAWTTSGGINLYYERNGSGPPLLFISGTGGDLRLKPNGFDQPFAADHDTVCYDQRGLGQSDQPPGPYSMAQYGDDAAAILDAVGFESAAVVGVSFGGMVAQELVLRHPDRVNRLVLACTSSGGAGGSSYPLHELVGKSVEERIGVSDSRWSDPSFADPVRDAVAAATAVAPPPSAGALLQLDARKYHDTYDRLDQIACPVYIAAGRYDGVAPPANAAAMADRIPSARLEIFEGGHGFLRQDPRAVVAVHTFLNEGR